MNNGRKASCRSVSSGFRRRRRKRRNRSGRMNWCRYPLVLRQESSSSRSVVDQALREVGIHLADCNVVLQVSGNEALKRAVSAGAGIGFVSRRAVESELASGALATLKIEGLPITRRFYALRRPNPDLPLVEELWRYMVANGQNPQNMNQPNERRP